MINEQERKQNVQHSLSNRSSCVHKVTRTWCICISPDHQDTCSIMFLEFYYSPGSGLEKITKKKMLKFARPLLPHSCTTLREHWLKCCACLCELMRFIVWNVYCFHCIPVNVAVDFDPLRSEYSCLPGPPLPLAYLHTCHTCSHTQIILLHSIIIYILFTLLYIQPTPWSETEGLHHI